MNYRSMTRQSTTYHVPTHYTIGTEYPSLEAAIEAAKQEQERMPYCEQWPENEALYTRKFVELRQQAMFSDGSGVDERIMLWEIFPWGACVVPAGQGGLTDEQRDEFRLQHTIGAGV